MLTKTFALGWVRLLSCVPFGVGVKSGTFHYLTIFMEISTALAVVTFADDMYSWFGLGLSRT